MIAGKRIAAILFKNPNVEDTKDYYQSAIVEEFPNHCSASDILFQPVLRFQNRPYVEIEPIFLQPEKFSAAIVTSPRAARRCAEIVQTIHQVNRKCAAAWWDKTLYVVGDSTSAIFQTAGFRRVVGKDSGSAAVLAEFIVATEKGYLRQKQERGSEALKPDMEFDTTGCESTVKRHLVFFCGAVKKDTLPNALARASISMEQVVIYDAVAVRSKITSESAICSLIPASNSSFTSCSCKVDVLIFGYFSPRGVGISDIPAFLYYIESTKSMLNDQQSNLILVFATIGKATAKKVKCTLQTLCEDKKDIYIGTEHNRNDSAGVQPSLKEGTNRNLVLLQQETNMWLLQRSKIRIFLCTANKPKPKMFANAISGIQNQLGGHIEVGSIVSQENVQVKNMPHDEHK